MLWISTSLQLRYGFLKKRYHYKQYLQYLQYFHPLQYVQYVIKFAHRVLTRGKRRAAPTKIRKTISSRESPTLGILRLWLHPFSHICPLSLQYFSVFRNHISPLEIQLLLLMLLSCSSQKVWMRRKKVFYYLFFYITTF